MDAPGPSIRINILGPTEVWVNGACLKLSSRRLTTLLGWVASSEAKRVKKDEVAAVLWPDSDPQTRRRNLRQLVFLARQALGAEGESLVLTDDDDLWLDDLVTTDLEQFRSLAESPRRDDQLQAQELYRGLLLTEVDDPSILVRRQLVHEEWANLSYALVNQLHKDGDSPGASQIARSLVSADPLDERARFAVVRLLAASNNLSAAKAEYADLESRLRRDLGVAPSVPLPRLLAKADRNRPLDELPSPPPMPRPKGKSYWLLVPIALGLVVCVAAAFLNRPPADPKELLASLSTTKSPPSTQLASSLEQIGEAAWLDAYGPREESWRALLAPQERRLFDVMEWAIQNEPTRAVKIGGALVRYFLLINHQSEWAELLRQALARAPQDGSTSYARGQLALVIASPGGGESANFARLREAQAVCSNSNDAFLRIQAVRAEGFLNAYLQHHNQARDLYEKALQMAREAKEDRQIALCLVCLGVMGPDSRTDPKDDLARRLRCAVEAYDRFAELENIWGIRLSATILASNLRILASNGNAPSLAKEGLVRLVAAAEQERSVGNPLARLSLLASAAKLAVQLGENEAACDALVVLARESGGDRAGLDKRAKLTEVCFMIDPTYARQLFDEDVPKDLLPQQSPQQFLDSVLK